MEQIKKENTYSSQINTRFELSGKLQIQGFKVCETSIFVQIKERHFEEVLAWIERYFPKEIDYSIEIMYDAPDTNIPKNAAFERLRHLDDVQGITYNKEHNCMEIHVNELVTFGRQTEIALKAMEVIRKLKYNTISSHVLVSKSHSK